MIDIDFARFAIDRRGQVHSDHDCFHGDDRILSLKASRKYGIAYPGLPAPLPRGEHLVWQGTPRWRSLARQVFHTDLIWLYFAILAAWRVATALGQGRGLGDAALEAVPAAICAGLAVGLFTLLAWLAAGATIYTITSRRIVMRIGAAWSKNIDIPFNAIDSVQMKAGSNGVGSISIRLKGTKSVPYFILWPHARPWRLRLPEPMLRALPSVDEVARTLALHIEAAAEAGERRDRVADRWAERSASDAQAAQAPPPPRPAGSGSRVPLCGAAGLVVVSLLAVLWVQVSGTSAERAAARSPERVYDLHFRELAPDRLAVVDTRLGETITTVEPGRDGLILRAFRGLERVRGLRGLSSDAPYQLVVWDTGRVTLSDLETNRHISLDAFGPTSAGALADLLRLKSEAA